MITRGEHASIEPSCFLEALDLEYVRTRNRMMIYILRYCLARYPVDLLQYWWRKTGGVPDSIRYLAFQAYKAGAKPGRLYRGPSHWPRLRVIEGGIE